MAEYTYKDVIIDPEDPRVEIGAKYWVGKTPTEVLLNARTEAVTIILSYVDETLFAPFIASALDGEGFPCIIRKKEPEKKYVPFDLSKEEDRAKLRGAWIKVKDGNYREYQIISLSSEIIYCGPTRDFGFSPISLLEAFEFVDGSPCGKLVEEE